MSTPPNGHDARGPLWRDDPLPPESRQALEPVLTRGRRLRRRRRALRATGAVGAALVGAMLVSPTALDRIRDRDGLSDRLQSVATPTAGREIRRTSLDEVAEARLPWHPDAMGAIALGGAPITGPSPTQAAGLLQLATDPGGPIFRVAADGAVEQWPVRLMPAADRGGNQARALDPASLHRDGVRAAFAQPGGVVVFDQTVGRSRQFEVAGVVERVRWHRDGLVLVASGDRDSRLVDAVSGRTEPAPPEPRATTDDGGDGTLTLEPSESGGTPARLVRRDASGVAVAEYAVPDADAWYGRPVARGRLVAAGAVRVRSGPLLLAVLAVDFTSGQTVAELVLDGARPGLGCCEALSWFDESTVLLLTRGATHSRLLAWNPRTGIVQRFAEIDADVVASWRPLS